MELKYLTTFRTIVETGSFSKAAEHFLYTQSTITFQMGQLEQETSVKLFEKIGRKMVLTKAGENFVPYVDSVLESVEKLYSFENDLLKYRSDLRIGVAETILCYRLPAVLKEFHRQVPMTRLFLRSMNCYEIRNELINGSLDMGIFYENVGGFGSNLTVCPLGTYETALLASPEIRNRYPDFKTPGQTIPVPFITDEPNCVFRQIFEKYLQDKSICLDHTIELQSIPTIKNLVKNNVGIAFLPEFAAKEELQKGELVKIPTDITDNRISAICAHHKNKWLNPPMKRFIELCSGQPRG